MRPRAQAIKNYVFLLLLILVAVAVNRRVRADAPRLPSLRALYRTCSLMTRPAVAALTASARHDFLPELAPLTLPYLAVRRAVHQLAQGFLC